MRDRVHGGELIPCTPHDCGYCDGHHPHSPRATGSPRGLCALRGTPPAPAGVWRARLATTKSWNFPELCFKHLSTLPPPHDNKQTNQMFTSCVTASPNHMLASCVTASPNNIIVGLLRHCIAQPHVGLLRQSITQPHATWALASLHYRSTTCWPLASQHTLTKTTQSQSRNGLLCFLSMPLPTRHISKRVHGRLPKSSFSLYYK
jgi:hypothetical protein